MFSVRAARRVRAASTPHSREKLLSPSFVRRSSTASPSNRRDASTCAPPRRVASTTSARNDARRRRHSACSGARSRSTHDDTSGAAAHGLAPSTIRTATLDGQPKQPSTHLEVRAIRRAESCRRRRHATKHGMLVDTSCAAVHGLLWHGGADAARHRSMQRWSMSLEDGDGGGYEKRAG